MRRSVISSMTIKSTFSRLRKRGMQIQPILVCHPSCHWAALSLSRPDLSDKPALSENVINHGGVVCVARNGITLTKLDRKYKPKSFEVLCVRIRSGNSTFDFRRVHHLQTRIEATKRGICDELFITVSHLSAIPARSRSPATSTST